MGPVDGTHARPLLHLRATSVARSLARRLPQKDRPTLPLVRSSSHRSATLQRTQIEKPFSAHDLWPCVGMALPCHPEVPPSGFGYPHGGVSLSIPGSLFQLPTLMGFALQGIFPNPQPVQSFPRTFRSCAFRPNPSAWSRRFSGLRLRDQRHPPALPPSSGRSGDPALLSFRASQVLFRRI